MPRAWTDGRLCQRHTGRTTAPHQEGAWEERRLIVDNQAVPYDANLLYAMLATFAGLPATAFPGGVNAAGLPLGLQAIGPYLEDRTTLKFAQLVEEAWYRFEPPPGYGGSTSG